MRLVTTAELIRSFGTYSDIALNEPLVITKNARQRLVLLNVDEYNVFRHAVIRRRAQRAKADRAWGIRCTSQFGLHRGELGDADIAKLYDDCHTTLAQTAAAPRQDALLQRQGYPPRNLFDRRTGTAERKVAKRKGQLWKREIEREKYLDRRGSKPAEAEPTAARGTDVPPLPATFLAAAVAYMKAGGERKRLGPIINHFGPASLRDLPIERIDQLTIDNAAADLFPNATPQTKNREFYTPVAAVLHRAGVERRIKRPVGWKGFQSTSWLEPQQAFSLVDAATAIDAEFGLLVRFLIYTGVRLGEALNVRLRDLHLNNQTLYVRKPRLATPAPSIYHRPWSRRYRPRNRGRVVQSALTVADYRTAQQDAHKQPPASLS